MTATLRLDAIPVNQGGGDASGDFTSGTFTTVAGTLLVAVVTIDNQNGTVPSSSVPTPTTSGTTWVNKLAIDSNSRGFSTGIYIYEAASPGAGSGNTFAMSSADGSWDNNINSIHLRIFEFDDALAIGSQTGMATGSQVTNNDSAVDPGAQTVTLDASPASTSYTIGVAAIDGDPPGVTEGSGFTEVSERLGTSSGPYMSSQVQIRDPGSTSTSVPWADLQTGGGTHVFDYRLGAIEVLAAGAAAGQPMELRGTQVPHYAGRHPLGRRF